MANEAHGGYNFCALASLHILGKVCHCCVFICSCYCTVNKLNDHNQANECNLAAQEYWLVQRQVCSIIHNGMLLNSIVCYY